MHQDTVFISTKEILRRTGYSRTRLHNKIKEALFISPIKFGERNNVWPQKEVEAFLRFMISEPSNEQVKEFVERIHELRKIDQFKPETQHNQSNYSSEIETKFNERRPNYLERYVYHAPLIEETIARFRRFKAFIQATGFEEDCGYSSSQHDEISELVTRRDHTSRWFLGKVPFFMTEPYSPKIQSIHGLVYFVVPQNIAPYCGGFHTDENCDAHTKSILYTKAVYSRHLKEVEKRLISAALNMPNWNSVTNEEREEARKRAKAMRGRNA